MPRKLRLTQKKGKDARGKSTRRKRKRTLLNGGNAASLAEQVSNPFNHNLLDSETSSALLICCDAKEEVQSVPKDEEPREIVKTTTKTVCNDIIGKISTDADVPKIIRPTVNHIKGFVSKDNERCLKNNLDPGKNYEDPVMCYVGPILLENLTVSIGVKDRARKTLPNGVLDIKRSPIHDWGVFSKLNLPIGLLMGPYEGEIKTKHESGTYCWGLKNGRLVDAEDETKSSWLRYINCARHSREQNLVSCQRRGKLYFRTTKLIPVGQELLVFYGLEFAKYLNIDVNNYFNRVPIDVENYNTNTEMEKSSTKEEESNVKVNCSNELREHVREDPRENLKIHNIESTIEDSLTPKLESTNKYHLEMCHETDKIESELIQYRCTICKFVTNKRSALKNHILIHANKTPFVCKFCDFSCKQMSYLTKHTRVLHMNKEISKKFACEECPYRATRKSTLNRHKLRHTGEKLYHCQVCQKRFVEKRNIKLHMNEFHRDIMDEKDKMELFHCDSCSYSTVVKIRMKSHSIRHSSNKPFVCKLCDSRYKMKCGLKMHIEAHHKVTYELVTTY